MLPQLLNETNGLGLFRPFFVDWDDTKEATDLIEQEDKFVFHMDIPGFKKEEVKIEIKDNTLKVEASKSQEKNEDKNNVYRGEKRALRRSGIYSLPDNILEEKIEAKVEDGILSVFLPKKEESKPKLIPIK